MWQLPWWRLRYVERETRNLLFELRNAFRLLWAKRLISRCYSFGRLRLNLGCGKDHRAGWINLDIDTGCKSYVDSPQNTAVISMDLRHGIPLPDNAVEYIYSSHFWEHLDADEGLFLFREAARVLKPGGQFRIALPNVWDCINRYSEDSEEFFGAPELEKRRMQVLPGIRNDLDVVNYAIFQNGQHKIAYNSSKLVDIFKFVGLVNIVEDQFDASVDVSEELRRRYSFYIQAEKGT